MEENERGPSVVRPWDEPIRTRVDVTPLDVRFPPNKVCVCVVCVLCMICAVYVPFVVFVTRCAAPIDPDASINLDGALDHCHGMYVGRWKFF